MIEYIIAENPDDRILKRASENIRAGGLICFPSDTNWVVAASACSKKGIDALYDFKGAEKGKHFSMMCNSISDASRYGTIFDHAFRLIKKVLPGPYTFIFSPTKEIPRAVRGYRKEHEIGIRIPDNTLCQRLVSMHGEPLVTSSLTHQMLKATHVGNTVDDSVPIYSYLIEEAYGHLFSMIIDPGEFEFFGESSVVSFANDAGMPEVIREGAGDVSFFS